jgi:hypothetical protein
VLLCSFKSPRRSKFRWLRCKDFSGNNTKVLKRAALGEFLRKSSL